MSRVRLAACVLLALAVLVTWVILLANTAVGAEVNKRPCVTHPEAMRLPKDDGKQAVEEWVDTRGWVAYRDLMVLVKHYSLCGHPYGWLSVGYVRTKGSPGWTYYGSVEIDQCMHKEGDGPWIPCDPTKVHWLEGFLIDQSDRGGS
jgi:hypothetical protein